jgi:DNA-binding transcriptional regulator YiaG
MIESNFRVLEFSKDDFEKIIRDTVSTEIQKIMGMVSNFQFTKPKSDLMTREEVSLLLNVSLVTLHNWEKKKILISKKMGGRVLYLREDVYAKLN